MYRQQDSETLDHLLKSVTAEGLTLFIFHEGVEAIYRFNDKSIDGYSE